MSGPGAGRPPRPRWRADLAVALAALFALVGWELGGLDLPVSAAFGDIHGFAWRDGFWTRTVLHDGARHLAVLLLALLVAAVMWPRADGWQDGGRRAHARALLGLLLCLTVVPTLKQFSTTSCPYELSLFGGIAAYVPHWRLGVADGGPGHCFPSGHAVSALAFMSLYFGWRERWPGAARKALGAVLLAALVLGATQLVRGAHFASHTFWSAWCCWSLCAGLDAVRVWGRRGSAFRTRPQQAT